MLSHNFTRAEFKCKCGRCDYDTVDAELIRALQSLRDYVGAPITITSGNRCPEYNLSVGGSEKSQHLKGRAADIQVEGVTPETVQKYLKHVHQGSFGIGSYGSFTHIDTRTKEARWNG